MTRRRAKRYPLRPLLERTGTPTLRHLADRLELTHDYIRQAARTGITEWQADHWAVRLGVPAAAVWRELWWANAADPHGRCSCPHPRPLDVVCDRCGRPLAA